MIAEQLKKSLLQAAIQGKLSKQLESDGDVKDLLRVISKNKTLPEISDGDIPFEIPNTWHWVKLGNLFTIARGGSPRPIQSFLTNGIDGINWIKIGDSDIGGKYINQTKEKIIPSGVKKSRMVFPGDLLLTNSMSFGRPYINNIKGCIHDGWLVLSPLSELLNKEFFYYLLSSEFIKLAFAHTVAGAVVKNLNSDKVRDIFVPLPPTNEQYRIVERLESLLPKIESLKIDETKLEVLQKSFPKKMKDSILQAAISGKLTEHPEVDGNARDLLKEINQEKDRLIKEGKIKKEKPLPRITEDEIPFDIPENWCWVRLGEIIYNHGQKKPDKDFTYIDITSIDNKNNALGDLSNVITPKDAPSRARKIIHEGDVLYATVRPYLHNICVIDQKIVPEPIASTGFAVVSTINSMINRFLFYCFLSPMFDSYANDHDNSKGVAYPAINDDKFSKALIPLPPIEEQKRIVEQLIKMLPLCDALE